MDANIGRKTKGKMGVSDDEKAKGKVDCRRGIFAFRLAARYGTFID